MDLKLDRLQEWIARQCKIQDRQRTLRGESLQFGDCRIDDPRFGPRRNN